MLHKGITGAENFVRLLGATLLKKIISENMGRKEENNTQWRWWLQGLRCQGQSAYTDTAGVGGLFWV